MGKAWFDVHSPPTQGGGEFDSIREQRVPAARMQKPGRNPRRELLERMEAGRLLKRYM